VEKDGFFQKEVKYAIDAYEEKSHIKKIIQRLIKQNGRKLN